MFNPPFRSIVHFVTIDEVDASSRRDRVTEPLLELLITDMWHANRIDDIREVSEEKRYNMYLPMSTLAIPRVLHSK